jgi:hypothetical protein
MADGATLTRRAFRLLLASGLLFTLLLLLLISGVASVTLMHTDSPHLRPGAGLQQWVYDAVTGMARQIRGLHGWGGFAAIPLASWAGFEALRLGRALGRGPCPARRIRLCGGIGAGIVILSLCLLLFTGVLTQAWLEREKQPLPMEMPAAERAQADARREMLGHREHTAASLHTRELNILLAFGTLLLVVAANEASKLRRGSSPAKAARNTPPDNPAASA